MTKIPTFAQVLDRAEEFAVDEQSYEVARLIAAGETERAHLERTMPPADLRRYDAIVYRAWLELSLKGRIIGRLCD